MTYKILYIDDGESNAVQAYADALQDTSLFEVSVEEPRSFEQEVSHLIKTLENFDAVLLDYRLNDFKNQDGIIYDAPTIAQDIRSKVVKGQIKEIPIILISSDEIIKDLFKRDLTSRDLFDLFYDKGKFANDKTTIAQQISSLIEAYKTVDNNSSLRDGLNLENLNLLDSRLIEAYKSIERKEVTYGMVNFVLHTMIEVTGPLINEAYLAARLGIDKEQSSDWDALLKMLNNEVGYKGIFCKAYPRWWSVLLEKWWRSLSSNPISLRSSIAEKRVGYLKEALNLRNIVPAKPLKYASSSSFWTVCYVKRKPLDTLDGLKLFRKDTHLWYEQEYVSIIAALEDSSIRQELLPTERERLSLIRERMDGR